MSYFILNIYYLKNHEKLLKKDNLHKINQILSHQSLIIRDSPMRIHIYKNLEDYKKSRLLMVPCCKKRVKKIKMK